MKQGARLLAFLNVKEKRKTEIAVADMKNNEVVAIESSFYTTGRGMTPKRRKLCQAFFLLDDPTDAESFWLHLKATGIAVSRAQVYKTLSLLADYGFAERCRDTQKRINYFKPV